MPPVKKHLESLVASNPQEWNFLKTNEHKILCEHQALALLLQGCKELQLLQ